MNSLRHINPQSDEERQWQWKEDSVIRLQNPESQDELLTSGAGREEFDVTGKNPIDLTIARSQTIFSSRCEKRYKIANPILRGSVSRSHECIRCS